MDLTMLWGEMCSKSVRRTTLKIGEACNSLLHNQVVIGQGCGVLLRNKNKI